MSPRELHGDMDGFWRLRKLAKRWNAAGAAEVSLDQPFWFSEHEHSFKLASFDDIAKTTHLLDDSKENQKMFKDRLKHKRGMPSLEIYLRRVYPEWYGYPFSANKELIKNCQR